MSKDQRGTRREFLSVSANVAALAGTAVAGGCHMMNQETSLKDRTFLLPKPVGKVLRLGAIGVGGRGRSMLKVFISQKDIELKAICDPNEANRNETLMMVKEKTASLPDIYTGPEDYRNKLLAREDIDVLLIATPCYLHAPMYLDCFTAGKHFYGEKPMCLTVKEADALVAAQKRNPRVVGQIGFQRRALSIYQQAIQGIHDGLIGEQIAGYGAWNSSWGPLGLPSQGTHAWFGRRKFSGDWMLEQACHTWDVFNWIAGDLPVAANGIGRKDLLEDLDPERDVTDFYNAQLLYPNGLIVDFEHNWLLPKSEKKGENIFSGVFERVVGPKGGVSLTTSKGKFLPRQENGKIIEWAPPYDEGGDSLRAFIKSVRDGTPPVSNVNNGRMATLTGLLVRKAVDEQKWVKMEDIIAEG